MKSKKNLELKHYCSDFVAIRKILKEIGAHKVIVKNQKDYFFYLPKSSSKIPPRLKLRIEGKSQTLVYYRRPDFKANVSTTAEVSLYSVKDKQLLPYLQQILGVQAIVMKRRELWRKGNTVFNLDTVKGVGTIFEIELQASGKISKKDKDVFQSYQKKLSPYLGEVIKGSNIDLVLKNK